MALHRKKCNINSLELQATFFCLKDFYRNKTILHVLLNLDNTKAVAYIDKKGDILVSCNKRRLELDKRDIRVRYLDHCIPCTTVKDITADLRYRLFYDNKNWFLNQSFSNLLFDKFGEPEIDLLASRLNAKCTKYES